jgi:FkbM family methyltransferase
MIFQKVSNLYWKLYYSVKIYKYKKLGKGHVFNISIDDIKYKLSFGNQKIGPAIVQRIEGRREPETMAIYRSLVRPGQKVIEIGACYGEFTMLLSRCVGDTGEVIAIEGTPNTYKILEHNLQINNAANVKPFELFLSGSDNMIRFGENETDPYKAIERLKLNNIEDSQTSKQFIEKKPIKLSDFIKKNELVPDHIFMDIEGFERDVLYDLMETNIFESTKKRPIIMFEMHLDEYPNGITELNEMLKKMNYDWVRIGMNRLCYPKL